MVWAVFMGEEERVKVCFGGWFELSSLVIFADLFTAFKGRSII